MVWRWSLNWSIPTPIYSKSLGKHRDFDVSSNLIPTAPVFKQYEFCIFDERGGEGVLGILSVYLSEMCVRGCICMIIYWIFNRWRVLPFYELQRLGMWIFPNKSLHHVLLCCTTQSSPVHLLGQNSQTSNQTKSLAVFLRDFSVIPTASCTHSSYLAMLYAIIACNLSGCCCNCCSSWWFRFSMNWSIIHSKTVKKLLLGSITRLCCSFSPQ